MTRATLDRAAAAANAHDPQGAPNWVLRATGATGHDGGRLRPFTGDERRYIAAAGRRIARLLSDARDLTAVSDGLAWYGVAHGQACALARELGHSLDHTVVAVAHASAGRAWASNLDAVRAAADVAHGRLTARQAVARRRLSVGVTGYAPLDRAAAALRAYDPWATLVGPKVSAFAESIITSGRTHHVCIDGHAVNAADGRQHGGHRASITHARTLAPVAYDAVAAAYATAAIIHRDAGAGYIAPAQVQAIVWIVWRTIPTRRRP